MFEEMVDWEAMLQAKTIRYRITLHTFILISRQCACRRYDYYEGIGYYEGLGCSPLVTMGGFLQAFCCRLSEALTISR